MAQRRPVERLRQLSSARRQGNARDSRGLGHVRELSRGVDAAAPVRTRRRHHGQDHRDPQHVGRGARAPPGGVDRSRPRRRAARLGAAAAEWRGAQCRRDRVRLVIAQVLHPRPDRHRQAETHGQRLRRDLWRRRAEHGSPADPGPGQGDQDHHEGANPRSGRPQLGAGEPGGGAVAVLRHGTSVGFAGQRAQPDDGSGRAGLLHGANPLAQESTGVLRGSVGPSVGEGIPAHENPGRVRSELAPGHGI